MILLKTSEQILESNDSCPHCHGPLTIKAAKGQPVMLQTAFGVSFIVFILIFERIKNHPQWLWVWSGIQIILGIFLVRARIDAKKRIYRCVRCGATIR